MPSKRSRDMETAKSLTKKCAGFLPPVRCPWPPRTTPALRTGHWQNTPDEWLRRNRTFSKIARQPLHLVIKAVGRDDVSSQNGAAFEKNDSALSPAAVKDKLVNILQMLINDDSQLAQVEQSIMQLEGLNAIPITPDFTEMALAGEWSLLFSSMRIRSKNGVRIRELNQHFDIGEKSLVNNVSWSFPDKLGVDSVEANMKIICKYSFVGPGRLKIELEQHSMSISERPDGKPSDLPDDLQLVINELRLSLPIEFFDPSGLSDITYIEPDFRVTRYIGKRTAGIRNVFKRAS